MGSDRELLFGLLALQNDCVSRESLIAGMQVWLHDKSRSVAAILQQRNAIDADACALLQRLVELHVKQHGDDPQRSLASLSSLGSIREDLRKLGDDDIEATLIGMVDRSLQDTIVPSPADAEGRIVPGTREANSLRNRTGGSRFRILRPHARGGLGEVFVARDEELNREVALKEIQSHLATNQDCRSRFVLEAEVTGGLEHPGIVPVYGLGQYDDGRPYYAMRFIKGDSLKEAIDAFHSPFPPLSSKTGDQVADRRDQIPATSGELPGDRLKAPDFHGLDFRKLLGRFIDVCQAISYAHSRGVLHRDLKPGNIMLGKYGETLVVDWGLARIEGREVSAPTADEQILQPASGSGVTPTVMGNAIGTPAYMPPEQAAGRLEELGPASDVYSLGATLYHLLMGTPPFKGRDVVALLKDVQAGAFPSPRSIQPQVPKSLEAVSA